MSKKRTLGSLSPLDNFETWNKLSLKQNVSEVIKEGEEDVEEEEEEDSEEEVQEQEGEEKVKDSLAACKVQSASRPASTSVPVGSSGASGHRKKDKSKSRTTSSASESFFSTTDEVPKGLAKRAMTVNSLPQPVLRLQELLHKLRKTKHNYEEREQDVKLAAQLGQALMEENSHLEKQLHRQQQEADTRLKEAMVAWQTKEKVLTADLEYHKQQLLPVIKELERGQELNAEMTAFFSELSGTASTPVRSAAGTATATLSSGTHLCSANDAASSFHAFKQAFRKQRQTVDYEFSQLKRQLEIASSHQPDQTLSSLAAMQISHQHLTAVNKVLKDEQEANKRTNALLKDELDDVQSHCHQLTLQLKAQSASQARSVEEAVLLAKQGAQEEAAAHVADLQSKNAFLQGESIRVQQLLKTLVDEWGREKQVAAEKEREEKKRRTEEEREEEKKMAEVRAALGQLRRSQNKREEQNSNAGSKDDDEKNNVTSGHEVEREWGARKQELARLVDELLAVAKKGDEERKAKKGKKGEVGDNQSDMEVLVASTIHEQGVGERAEASPTTTTTTMAVATPNTTTAVEEEDKPPSPPFVSMSRTSSLHHQIKDNAPSSASSSSSASPSSSSSPSASALVSSSSPAGRSRGNSKTTRSSPSHSVTGSTRKESKRSVSSYQQKPPPQPLLELLQNVCRVLEVDRYPPLSPSPSSPSVSTAAVPDPSPLSIAIQALTPKSHCVRRMQRGLPYQQLKFDLLSQRALLRMLQVFREQWVQALVWRATFTYQDVSFDPFGCFVLHRAREGGTSAASAASAAAEESAAKKNDQNDGPLIPMGVDYSASNGVSLRYLRWQSDADASITGCSRCHVDFSLVRRKHHCRMCGGVVCYLCSNKRTNLTMPCALTSKQLQAVVQYAAKNDEKNGKISSDNDNNDDKSSNIRVPSLPTASALVRVCDSCYLVSTLIDL